MSATLNCATQCLYCQVMLSPRHEHDHFPLPFRHGGDETVCVCLNCHDLKDRVPLNKWDAQHAMQSFSGLWGKAEPLERIALAKLLTLFVEASAQLNSR